MFPNTYFAPTYFTPGYFTVLTDIIISVGGTPQTSRYWKMRQDRKLKEEFSRLKKVHKDDEEILEVLTTMFQMGIFNG